MTRCDYDGVFYRVFCVTLLAIAFTFTVILTNVFIDIDGLLSTKEKAKSTPKPMFEQDLVQAPMSDIVFETKPETFYGDVKTFEEEDTSYRTKRSLDSPTFQFHLKNAKMKKILTNKLATLLEELDEEESNIDPNTNKQDEPTDMFKKDTLKPLTESLEHKKAAEAAKTKFGNHNDILHLAMHNILLQGIIRHMDLNDVYKKAHTMVENFEKNEKKNTDSKDDINANLKFDENFGTEQFQSADNVEDKFFEELTNCDDLHKQVYEETEKGAVEKHQEDSRRISPKNSSPKTLINTIIDIKSMKNDKSEHNATSKETIKGVIRLIYNGKPVKFNQMEEEPTTTPYKGVKYQIIPIQKKPPPNLPGTSGENKFSENLINQAIANYFDKFPDLSEHLKAIKDKSKFSAKRLKREIRVWQEQEVTTEKPKQKHETKKDEEELYVEIETHFDSKGMKGDKKRKLIRNIIDKIQKAIHADIDSLQDNDFKDDHIHVKKRLQNPLDDKKDILNNVLIPLSKVLHRELYPISKVVPAEETVPHVADNVGESWKKTYYGPNFLSAAKSINSAELGELDLDYNNVLRSNGIPQRLQQPLSTDGVEEPYDSNTYVDFGNLKFLIKDIDGSGFSIGLNQYVGEPPDAETMKLFTGLENLIKTYQQNYDDVESAPESNTLTDKNLKSVEKGQEMSTREDDNHAIVRRSVEDKDYHSNEYKVIFTNNFLPYDSYQEIYEDKNKKVSLSIQKENNSSKPLQASHVHVLEKDIKTKESPFLLDETILEQNLEPSQIFGIASLLERKKRSLNVKKYRKLNAKSKLSRFINTNVKTTKKYFVKSKRNKRQADNNIRIIATDRLPNTPARSDENIFVVSSDENMKYENVYNRAVQTEDVHDVAEDAEREDDTTPEMFPYLGYNKPEMFNADMFATKSRHNALMSKYPHILLEEISRSKEDMPANYRTIFDTIQVVDDKPLVKKRDGVPEATEPSESEHIPKDLFEALAPKTNYKLIVKILPKNISRNMHSGFKEVHTSINKSVNRNGLLYSSQLNVTQVSKVENMSKSEPVYLSPPIVSSTMSPIIKHIREQQEKMKLMLRQHKQKIDEQLDNLKKDKHNIESVMVNNSDRTEEFIDILLPLDPPRVLHLNKDVAGQLITSALVKLHDTPQINSLATNIKQEPTSLPTTLPTTTTVPCITSKPDVDKISIINSIQHNENLTNRILNKIDQNTDFLQSFLQKLTDRLDRVTAKPEVKFAETTHRESNTKTEPMKVDDLHPRDWREYSPFFNQMMPNLEVRKNSTHVTIPFVYAYQQPYPLPSHANSPIASVVYQGHIHTNAVRKNNLINEKMAKSGDGNETRFFIDELESNYKDNPVLNVDKPYPVAFNGTHGPNK